MRNQNLLPFPPDMSITLNSNVNRPSAVLLVKMLLGDILHPSVV